MYLIYNQVENLQDDPKSYETIIIDSLFTTLVWSDEFNGNGAINSENWFHQTQLPPGGNWYGGLIQHYTNREDNSHLKNGFLNHVAKKKFLTTRVK